MAHSPGPIQTAGTLTGSDTDDTVLTSSDAITVDLHLDTVTAAEVTVTVVPLGGSAVELYAAKTLGAGAHAIYSGIALGAGDVLQVSSDQTNTQYVVFTSAPGTVAGVQVTNSAGAQTTASDSTGSTFFAQYFLPATLAAVADVPFFVATRACRVIAISEVHGVAAGGTSTLQVTKDTGTTAPGAGTDLLATPFNLNATANTVQSGALSATPADLVLAAGDRLSVDFANAIQATTTLAITVELQLL